MTPVVRVKPGVQFRVIAPAGFVLLAAIQGACEWLQTDLTITCGTEAHAASDPHSLGEAYDVSVKGLTDSQIIALVTGLTRNLGAGFYVTYESPNVPQGILAMKAFMSVNGAASAPHVHLQRARGTTYPANTVPV